MTNARGILEERLAKGEITEEEFERLSAKLSTVGAEKNAQIVSDETAKAVGQFGGKVWKGFQWFGAGVIAFVAVAYFQSYSARSGLVVGNVTASGARVSLTVTNKDHPADDVVFEVIQEKITRCLFKTFVPIRSSYDVKFYCSGLRDGKFSVKYFWAASDADKASLAKKI